MDIKTGDSSVAGVDTIYNFDVGMAGVNDILKLPSMTIATASNGFDVSGILSDSILNGMISFDDAASYSTALVVNNVGGSGAVTVTAATNYLATNIVSGQTVAFYVDGDNSGGANPYDSAADYLRVFQGGATAVTDLYVDIYNTAGGVTALDTAVGANRVVIA